MIVLWLIGRNHRHFARWIGDVGIGGNRKAREIGDAEAKKSAPVGRVGDVEMAVDRVIGIESHPENSGALALPDFESNIEKRRRIHRSRGQVDDLDLSPLLGDKNSASVPGRRTDVKRNREPGGDPSRLDASEAGRRRRV